MTISKTLKNFLSISFAELFGKLLGFIAIVYLARVISPDSFGIIAFVAAFVTYFTIFVDFGFDVISLKKISRNHSIIKKYVNNVVSIKLLNAVIIYIILIIVTLLIDKSWEIKIGLFICGFIVFVHAVSIEFAFQGVEKFKYISYKIFGRSTLYILLIVLFIKDDSDIYYILFFIVISNLISSLWLYYKYSMLYGKYKFNIDKRFMKALIKESYPLLISVIMATIYGNLDIVMLGFMKSNYEVGIYNASYKIYLLSVIPISILLKVYLPTLSRFQLINKFKEELVVFIFTMILLGASILIPIYFFASQLLSIIFGGVYILAEIPLKILAMTGIIGTLSNTFGNPLTVWGKQKIHAVCLTFGAITNIIFNFLLIPSFSYNGAAIATLGAELVVFCTLFFAFNKLTIPLFLKRTL